MFNGIIKNTGIINKLTKKRKNYFLEIKSELKFQKNEIGSSISCSGACLTLDSYKKKISNFYLSIETIDRTNFKLAKKGQIVNLEKSIKFGERLSGHFVQGHIDTKCTVLKINIVGKSWIISFNLKKRFKKHIVEKGSIAINGVSLTISRILKNGFQIAIIPKTLKLTNLIYLKKKDVVNLEFDVLGKYINNFIK